MTVFVETDFEAEALDLDHAPSQDEIFPDDPTHWLGPLSAEVRLVGTRRKYQVCTYVGGGSTGRIGMSIWTGTDAANAGLAEHAENRGIIKVILGAVQFKARLTVSRHSDVPTISDLFRNEPVTWGLRGDPHLWADMQDYFADWMLPLSYEELDMRIGEAFRDLTGASIDSDESISLSKYDLGGMSSGQIDPNYWRNEALPHLREELAFEKGWKRPTCPSCGSEKVATILCGFPGPEMFENQPDDDIVLGGCCVTENDPRWSCKDCGHQW